MRRFSLFVLFPPVIFLGIAALFLVSMQRDDPQALPSTREGQAAPALEVTALGQKPGFDGATLRGDSVKLVNYWASWCAPCRAEHSQLMTLAGEGVEIYGINYKDEPAKALTFLSELGDPFDGVMADPAGRTGLEWGTYGVPETFVIDSDGRIVKRFAGPITRSVLESTIRPAIAEARARESG